MKKKWWKEAIVYQIYPRSFYDSNNDGIGDLRGIIEKLDYIKNLGVDIIWLSPIYQSPNADNGYDISDYHSIMHEFGNMDNFDELLNKVHNCNMKLIMDLVVNHTSDEHPWFIESRSSKNNPKRDYYIWLPPNNGKEPNNWQSFFSGSSWEYDENTNEYYLHLFSVKQPDLNWKNVKVRQEIYKMMKWWLDKGIDGFRMDVINLLAKPKELYLKYEGNNNREVIYGGNVCANQPGIHEILKEMNKEVLSKYDIMTVGEVINTNPKIGSHYVNEDNNELNMLIHWEIMDMKEWSLIKFKKIIKDWYDSIKDKGWNSVYLSNHDQPRHISRFGNDEIYREQCAKLFALLILTLPGTPFIYQGEEIGMTNVKFDSIDEYRDVLSINEYNDLLKYGLDEKEALAIIQPKSRDNARIPMQWDSTKNAGFTKGKPWIGVHPNYKTVNVENELNKKDSILNFYKKLIKLRKENLSIVYGNYSQIDNNDPEIFAYIRSLNDKKYLIVLNFSNQSNKFSFPEYSVNCKKELLISNYPVDSNFKGNTIILHPWEARLYKF